VSSQSVLPVAIAVQIVDAETILAEMISKTTIA
jgi:hypothetical protein